MKKAIYILIVITIFIQIFAVSINAAVAENEIVFADAGWDSIKFHNAVAGTIAKELYGYTYTEMPGSTTVLHEGLLKGEIDIHMEIWTDNIASYESDLRNKRLVELGNNFDDNFQGIYVPRYVIEGDEDRGISPLAPNLKYIWDLKDYPDLFKDNENPNMGRVYGSIPGWEVDEILHNKYLHYNLDDNFVYFRPGSEASLTTAITSAYEKGEPIAAYYWEPTWLLGKYDMVLLEDEPYNPETYKDGKTALPAVKVNIGVSNDFAKGNEEVIAFLKNYKTSSKLTSEALAYMQETEADYTQAAKWFLTEHEELLDEWLNAEDAQKMKDILSGKKSNAITKEKIFAFPFKIPLNLKNVDDVIKGFSVKYDAFFSKVRAMLGGFVSSINKLLNYIPWFIIILLVFIAQWRISKNIFKGLMYSAFLFLIGVFGLWELMHETLAIIIASVIISLSFGFPLGLLLSTSDRLDRMTRPILDTMQTMPVFVYLIPTMLFFGLGNPPAVIATTIYAIVPIVRLTNHGIRQIDKEVVEASMAFGSTSLQSLIKVQIPQALPTIMTGVNQTLMMAMAMVVTTSMIGATGLGMEVLIGVNRIEIGRGLVSGTAVVIIAIILDRITQGFIQKNEVNN